jgi:DNA-binding winged helix-turn-helix (wHTH) protein
MLDPERRELARGSEAIAAGPQVFDLLLCLVQNREHVFSKDELLDGVWSTPALPSKGDSISCR